MLVLLLLVSNLQYAGAEGIPNWRNNDNTPTAEKILEVPNAYEQEAENGFRIYKSLARQGGPDAFAIIGEDDFLIMESWMHYIKRFQGGQHVATIPLEPEDDFSNGGNMVANEQYAYVAASQALIQINLRDYSQIRYTYPIGDIGLYTHDLFFEGESLILETSQMGKYRFDPTNGSFTKTDLGIHQEYIQADEHKMLRVTYSNYEWLLDACDAYPEVIGIDSSGNLYLSVFDWNLDITASDYHRICKYDTAGKLVASTAVDRSNWFSAPFNEVRFGADERIYVMAVYEPFTAIYRLDNTLTASVYDPYVPIPEDMLETRPVEEPIGDETDATANDILAMATGRTRAAVRKAAEEMQNYVWTFESWSGNGWTYKYDSGKRKNIYTRPAFLANATPGQTFKGIPYSWGHMNAVTKETKRTGAYYDSFPSLIKKSQYTAGNCTTTPITNAIGIDCSGFVSAAYGLNNKVNSVRFFNDSLADTYYPRINYKDLQPMDMIVKNGHVMLFMGWTSGDAIYVIEANASNIELDGENKVKYNADDGKVALRRITKRELDTAKYRYRRPAHWCTNVSGLHNNNKYQQYTASQHKVVCSTCGKQDRTENHQFSVTASTAANHTRRCSSCGYSRTDTHSFQYTNITARTHTKTCTVCNKRIKENHVFKNGSGKCTLCGQSTYLTPSKSLPIMEEVEE